ncbi:hypothetical protein QCD60_12350 [Pokkaliibacter sp. MBI-7]|uniref:hypothetical protein n=1 Tax=Pokkaliibacter sp. MBI-7 TaxID=3040600 RepID=UPI00244CA70B|nr:hypothetical protein [Pokkaliibacter sp. MBI-7]MDH2433362.1 hypothetical protein [Pokkaliibacter sp. MBI-7]
MGNTLSLQDYLGTSLPGVVAAYLDPSGGDAITEPWIALCGVELHSDNSLTLVFSEPHALQVDQRLTVHLDDRTGVAEYDADLGVHRTSYKGLVEHVGKRRVIVTPIDYELWYSGRIVSRYRALGYEHPHDTRAEQPLPLTPLTAVPFPDVRETDNKIGVMITRAPSQPHTTVMAFLSCEDDHLFCVTYPHSFKAQLLRRDHHCQFVIDRRHRLQDLAAISTEAQLCSLLAHQVPHDHPLFAPLRDAFIAKSPWEESFFRHPQVELYHLLPQA